MAVLCEQDEEHLGAHRVHAIRMRPNEARRLWAAAPASRRARGPEDGADDDDVGVADDDYEADT